MAQLENTWQPQPFRNLVRGAAMLFFIGGISLPVAGQELRLQSAAGEIAAITATGNLDAVDGVEVVYGHPETLVTAATPEFLITANAWAAGLNVVFRANPEDNRVYTGPSVVENHANVSTFVTLGTQEVVVRDSGTPVAVIQYDGSLALAGSVLDGFLYSPWCPSQRLA